MKRQFLLIGCLVLMGIVNTVNSQHIEKKYTQKINYLLYLPEAYEKDTTAGWPLILFLHGGGERGANLDVVKTVGPVRFTARGKKLPFIVIEPQIPLEASWNPDILAELVKGISRSYRVDGERIYLTGLSIGGLGTWETAMKYPEMFAAIAPVSGWGDPAQLWKISRIPVWIFHGAKDRTVPVIASIAMADSLKKYGNVKLTIYPNGKHGNWTETYNREDLYRWFLEHKK